MLVAKGIFPSSILYFIFVKEFNASELVKEELHQLKTDIDFIGSKITASINFVDHAIFTVDQSFKEGLFKKWESYFVLETANNP